jgi:hypothetical protein
MPEYPGFFEQFPMSVSLSGKYKKHPWWNESMFAAPALSLRHGYFKTSGY